MNVLWLRGHALGIPVHSLALLVSGPVPQSRTVRVPGFTLLVAHKLVCHGFKVADRKHETLESETKIQYNQQHECHAFWFLTPPPTSPMVGSMETEPSRGSMSQPGSPELRKPRFHNGLPANLPNLYPGERLCPYPTEGQINLLCALKGDSLLQGCSPYKAP